MNCLDPVLKLVHSLDSGSVLMLLARLDTVLILEAKLDRSVSEASIGMTLHEFA